MLRWYDTFGGLTNWYVSPESGRVMFRRRRPGPVAIVALLLLSVAICLAAGDEWMVYVGVALGLTAAAVARRI